MSAKSTGNIVNVDAGNAAELHALTSARLAVSEALTLAVILRRDPAIRSVDRGARTAMRRLPGSHLSMRTMELVPRGFDGRA